MIKRDKFTEVPGSPHIIRDAILDLGSEKFRVEFRVNGSDLTEDLRERGDVDLDADSDRVLEKLAAEGVDRNKIFEWYGGFGFTDISD